VLKEKVFADRNLTDENENLKSFTNKLKTKMKKKKKIKLN
jgi:hypothetical protein